MSEDVINEMRCANDRWVKKPTSKPFEINILCCFRMAGCHQNFDGLSTAFLKPHYPSTWSEIFLFLRTSE